MNEFERLRRNILINQGGEIIPSYLVKTDDSIIYFELDNTPIESFYADFDTEGYDEELEVSYLIYNINGDEVKSHKIKEVCFGSSYNGVTNIGHYFLAGCSSLTSVDLSGLSNVTSIGDNFLYYCSGLTSVDLSPLSDVTNIGDGFLYLCSSLTSVDLSPLSNITSIGDYFLIGCSSLTTLIMGAETPPTLGSSAFSYSNNLSLILVPCGSENDYKTATNWINRASIIQGDC